MMGCVRAEEIVEEFPVVNIDSPALDAVRLLAEHQLNGLVVVTNTSASPIASVMPSNRSGRLSTSHCDPYLPPFSSSATKANTRSRGGTIPTDGNAGQ